MGNYWKKLWRNQMAQNQTNTLSNIKERENSILKNVYLWMTVGLALTAVVAYGVASSQTLLRLFLGSGITFLFIVVAQFVVVFYLSSRLNTMSANKAILSFALYSVLTGITLSVVFYAYSGVVISRAFFTTAALFGGMSFYGMTTKRDLDGIGHYVIMALWGIIAASVINIFLKSEGFYFLISIVGVIIFTLLTAWDTQKIKNLNASYGQSIDEETYIKLSIIGALMLYLDFINIFLYLLRIFGRNRE
jgi:FtsH-binding integral membrane protein